MKKIFASALAIALASIFLAGCGGPNKQVIRLSHSQIETHPDHLGAVAFKKVVESKLGDKYEVQIHPNASLGANEKVLDLVRKGSVEFLVISTANLESFDKLYSLFSIPYLFTSEEAYEKFISDTEILKQLSVNSKQIGFEPLAAFTAGTRNFYSKSPIKSVSDVQGKKFRVQAGPVNVAMMQAFGATAVPMSFGEVYNALKDSSIDGAENNELALTDQKHGEIAKYFSYDMHQMCPDVLIASEAFLKKLTPDERKVFDEAGSEAQKIEFAAWHGRIAEAKKQAEAMGVSFIDVDINEFRNKVLPLHELLITETPELKPLYEKASAANAAAIGSKN